MMLALPLVCTSCLPVLVGSSSYTQCTHGFGVVFCLGHDQLFVHSSCTLAKEGRCLVLFADCYMLHL
jgi:hypothetical protein